MNREIIFRGLSTETKKWVYGYYSDENGIKTDFPTIEPLKGTNNIPISWKIDKNTLGQYTGLKDKNGKKIFEGDIVQEVYFNKNIDKEERRYGKYIVKYNEVRAGYVPFACGDGCGCCESEVISEENAEVIGNIYEDDLESEVN